VEALIFLLGLRSTNVFKRHLPVLSEIVAKSVPNARG